MYFGMAGISWVIRTFFLPNPFLGTLYPDVYNWIVGSILWIPTFLIVGLFYKRGSFPALGAFLFLIFYFIHNELIVLSANFVFSKTSIFIILGLYTFVLGFIKSLFSFRGNY